MPSLKQIVSFAAAALAQLAAITAACFLFGAFSGYLSVYLLLLISLLAAAAAYRWTEDTGYDLAVAGAERAAAALTKASGWLGSLGSKLAK